MQSRGGRNADVLSAFLAGAGKPSFGTLYEIRLREFESFQRPCAGLPQILNSPSSGRLWLPQPRRHAIRKARERESLQCPQVLGIDEHRGMPFATTFCDLKNRRIFDIVPGRSEAELAGFLSKLQGREKVRVVCIDLSSSYRRLVRRYFPNARIVADRFHVVRLITHHFLDLARQIAPTIKGHRGLLSAFRKLPDRLTAKEQLRLQRLFEAYPSLRPLYEKMQAVRALMNRKHLKRRECWQPARQLLAFIEELKTSSFAPLISLAQTLETWSEPLAAMWRFWLLIKKWGHEVEERPTWPRCV